VVGLDGKIILKYVLKKWNGKAWTGFIWIRIGTGGGACQCGNEPSGSIIRGEFLEKLRTVSFSERTLLHGVN